MWNVDTGHVSAQDLVQVLNQLGVVFFMHKALIAHNPMEGLWLSILQQHIFEVPPGWVVCLQLCIILMIGLEQFSASVSDS